MPSKPMLILKLCCFTLLAGSTIAPVANACGTQEFSISNPLQSLKCRLGSGEKCYPGWGCFPEFEKSKELSNPVNHLLMFSTPPEEIDVHFFMFGCDRNRYKGEPVRYNASERTLQNITYDGNKETVLIIHGFTDKYDEMEWTGFLKDFIFSESCNYNVIGVDWRNASKTANYFKAVADTQMVGAIVAVYMRNLMSVYGQVPDQFTVVGHSLGAHVAGFVGANFTSPKIKAIYGLDPAGPAFRDISTQFRLDPDDANLVVTLTTNAGLTSLNGNGLNIPVGHYAFFVNGGYHQTGCEGRPGDQVSIFDAFFTSSASCSHQRPTWLVQVSANDTEECYSMGYQCNSYEDFLGGECGTCDEGSDECKPLYSFFDFWNEEADKTDEHEVQDLIYYVDTTESAPFCICHYQFIIYTGEGDSFTGNFKVSLEGELRDLEEFQFKKDNFQIEPNSELKTLVKSAKNIGRLKSIQIEAIAQKGFLTSADKKIAIEAIVFNYMSAPTERQRKRYSTEADLGGHQDTTLETSKGPKRLRIH